MFSSDEFVPLVVALQAAQQAGQGIVVQRQLTTVQNNWYSFTFLPYRTVMMIVYSGTLIFEDLYFPYRYNGWESYRSRSGSINNSIEESGGSGY